MKRVIPFLFFVVALFALSSNALSLDRDVCPACAYTTIQSAIDAAGVGDRVRVAQGTYNEQLGISDPRTLTISGGWSFGFSIQVADPSLTVVDAGNHSRPLVIYGAPSDISIENMTFQKGRPGDFGGGIRVLSSLGPINLDLRDVVTQDSDNAHGHGGGISLESYTYPLTARLTNVTVRTNFSRAAGGGMFVMSASYQDQGPGNAEVYIIDSVIHSNIADREGGGIDVWAQQKSRTRVVVINSTITGNRSNNLSLGGGGLATNDDGDPDSKSILEMYNTILYGNAAPLGADLTVDLSGTQSKADVYYSNVSTANYVTGIFNTGNNLNTDPLFTDPVNSDFHLQPTSPLINAGTTAVPTPPGLPSADFEGNSRVIGSAPDIGAYEFSPAKPAQGTLGTEMNITGPGLGTTKGKVFVGNVSPKVFEWTDSSIRCQLLRSPSPGTYDVTIQPKGGSPIVIGNGFTVKAPEIDSVAPTDGSAGAEVTVTGFFFGTKKGKVTLGGKNCKVLSWTMEPITGESAIHFVIPKGLSSGTQELKVTNAVGSDAMNFTVK